MKKALLILIMPLLSLTLYAQELPKQKEIGLTFSGLNSFGITYRIGNTKSLWRFNTLFLSGNTNKETADSMVTKSVNSGFSVKVGKEFRKPITENLSFRFGADVYVSYYKNLYDRNDQSIYNNSYSNKRIEYGPGINLVLGLNYKMGKSFIIGAELLPYFQYRLGTTTEKNIYREEEKHDLSGFSYGLSSTSALLSIVYQF